MTLKLRECYSKKTESSNYILCLFIGRINIVKLYILPKAMNRFSAIPTGTEGSTWRDEHWVLFCMLVNWTPIKNKFILKKKKVCSSVNRHLDFFHILAIVDIAAINIGVHVPLFFAFRSIKFFLLFIFLINLFFIGVQFTNIQNNTQCSSRQVPPSVPVTHSPRPPALLPFHHP